MQACSNCPWSHHANVYIDHYWFSSDYFRKSIVTGCTPRRVVIFSSCLSSFFLQAPGLGAPHDYIISCSCPLFTPGPPNTNRKNMIFQISLWTGSKTGLYFTLWYFNRVGFQKTEGRISKIEASDFKNRGLGFQKPRVGFQKPRVGFQKRRVGFQKPSVGFRKTYGRISKNLWSDSITYEWWHC